MGSSRVQIRAVPQKENSPGPAAVCLLSPFISSVSGTTLKGLGAHRAGLQYFCYCSLRLPNGLILAIQKTSFSYFLSNFCKRYSGSHNSSFEISGPLLIKRALHNKSQPPFWWFEVPKIFVTKESFVHLHYLKQKFYILMLTWLIDCCS